MIVVIGFVVCHGFKLWWLCIQLERIEEQTTSLWNCVACIYCM